MKSMSTTDPKTTKTTKATKNVDPTAMVMPTAKSTKPPAQPKMSMAPSKKVKGC